MKLLKTCFLLFILFFNLNATLGIEVLFSPNDNVKDRLIYLINNSKKRIYAAVFMLTEKNIAHALVDAKSRGVDVQIVSDVGSVKTPSGKIDFLKDRGIDIFVFNPSSKADNKSIFNNQPIMHNKFAIIDKKIWTGSFNWTSSANSKNHENVIIVSEDDSSVNKFLKQFELLKGYCIKSPSPKHIKTYDKELPSKAIHKQVYEFLKSIKKKLSSITFS